MQQNFIKMIDKNIHDLEKDNQFLEKAEQEILKEGCEIIDKSHSHKESS